MSLHSNGKIRGLIIETDRRLFNIFFLFSFHSYAQLEAIEMGYDAREGAEKNSTKTAGQRANLWCPLSASLIENT